MGTEPALYGLVLGASRLVTPTHGLCLGTEPALRVNPRCGLVLGLTRLATLTHGLCLVPTRRCVGSC